MGLRPRQSGARRPCSLLERLALSGRDRLYRPRVACPHGQAQWCRGACPHAQARPKNFMRLRTPKAFASRQAASTTNAEGSEGVASRRPPLQRVQLTISHVEARVPTRRRGPKNYAAEDSESIREQAGRL